MAQTESQEILGRNDWARQEVMKALHEGLQSRVTKVQEKSKKQR